MQYYRQQGRFDKNPQPGDQAFFYAGGTVGHTGIVTAVTDSSITVVEGNSADRVQKLRYSRTDSRIAGYGHPWYEQINDPEKEIPAEPNAVDLTTSVRLPLLKRGAAGTAVESAQLLLIHRGCNCGGRKNLLDRETPDGDFGPATEKAVRDFQNWKKLESDGKIGPDTWRAMIID